MSITISLNDVFDENELKILKSFFGYDETEDIQSIEGNMQKIILASINEYKEMIVGRGIPSRAEDIHQYRLVSLIKYYYGDRLPTEEEVSSMFQLTPTRSRSLIRNVRTRFRYDLEYQIKNTMKNVLLSAKKNEEGSDFRVCIQSDYVLAEVRRLTNKVAPRDESIRKITDSTRVYYIPCDTYQKLFKELFKDSKLTWIVN
jgi:hypothetical protein